MILVVGMLDLFGAIELKTRPPESKEAASPLAESDPLWLRMLAKFNIPLLWCGLSLLAAGAGRISVIGTMAAKAPWTGPMFFGLGVVAIVLARVFKRPFNGNLHEGFLVFSLATATIMATLATSP